MAGEVELDPDDREVDGDEEAQRDGSQGSGASCRPLPPPPPGGTALAAAALAPRPVALPPPHFAPAALAPVALAPRCSIPATRAPKMGSIPRPMHPAQSRKTKEIRKASGLCRFSTLKAQRDSAANRRGPQCVVTTRKTRGTAVK